MDSTISPKSVQKNIDQLKARLKQLQEQEGQLTVRRRELLTGPQDVRTARELEQTETELLIALHGKETAQSRLKALEELLPGLKKEEKKAKARLEPLTKSVHEKLAELEEVDQKILEQLQDLFSVLEARNDLAQTVCESTTEGQVLALRFTLSGAMGNHTPAHPIGSVLTDQFRRLTLFEPVKPAYLTDQLRELRHQQNRAAKAHRQVEEEKRRQALQPV